MYVLFSLHGNTSNILDTCQDLLSSLSPTTKKFLKGEKKISIKKTLETLLQDCSQQKAIVGKEQCIPFNIPHLL